MRDGEVRKIVLVVSRDAINRAGMNVILARVTETDRHRSLPTTVTVEPSEYNGLSATSFVLCHDVLTLNQSVLDPRPKGSLELGLLAEVEAALSWAMDL